MSSWVSHLPDAAALPLGRGVGLGMNAAELAANRRLAAYDVQDLNEPRLPYPDASFDAVLCAVQYLVPPVEVFAEVARVLRPGGRMAIATSQRCFPTNAIPAWHVLPPRDRLGAIATFLSLWIVTASRSR